MQAKTSESTDVFPTVHDLIALRCTRLSPNAPSRRFRSKRHGQWQSRVRGRGMDFDESRPYQDGDDSRAIDWRVTARSGMLHTKLFCEELDRTVLFVIDYRAAMRFATQAMLKCTFAARCAAALAWGAIRAGDRVGAIVLHENGHRVLRPYKGSRGVLALIHTVVQSSRKEGQSRQQTSTVMRTVFGIARPDTTVFIFSDFTDFDDQYAADIVRLSAHVQLNCVHIYDLFERTLPEQTGLSVRYGDSVRPLATHTAARTAHTRNFDAHTACIRHAVQQGAGRFESRATHMFDMFCRDYAAR